MLSLNTNYGNGAGAFPFTLLSSNTLKFCHTILKDRLSNLETEHKVAREALAQITQQTGDIATLDAKLEQAMVSLRILKATELEKQQYLQDKERQKKEVQAQCAGFAAAGVMELGQVTDVEKFSQISSMLTEGSKILSARNTAIQQEIAETQNGLSLTQISTKLAETELAKLSSFKKVWTDKESEISALAKKVQLLEKNFELFKNTDSSAMTFNVSLQRISNPFHFQPNGAGSLISGESLSMFHNVLLEGLNILEKMQMQAQTDLKQWKAEQTLNLSELSDKIMKAFETLSTNKAAIEEFQKKLGDKEQETRDIDLKSKKYAANFAERMFHANSDQIDQLNAEASQTIEDLTAKKKAIGQDCEEMRIALSFLMNSRKAINERFQTLLEVERRLKEKEDHLFQNAQKIQLLEPALKMFQHVVPTKSYSVILTPATLPSPSNSNGSSHSMSPSGLPGKPLTLGDLRRNGQNRGSPTQFNGEAEKTTPSSDKGKRKATDDISEAAKYQKIDSKGTVPA